MHNKDDWQRFSALLDEAMDIEAERRAEWIARLEIENPEAADFVRTYFETREKAAQQGFLEGSIAPGAVEPSWIGRQVGPYTIRALIGQGGMGNVWLALRSDGRFEGRFALKFLRAFVSQIG